MAESDSERASIAIDLYQQAQGRLLAARAELHAFHQVVIEGRLGSEFQCPNPAGALEAVRQAAEEIRLGWLVKIESTDVQWALALDKGGSPPPPPDISGTDPDEAQK